MRRTVLLLASMALAVLLSSGTALAEEKLDQQNAEAASSRQAFDSEYKHLAQVVTAGKSGELSKVSVRIQKESCSASSTSDPFYKDINVRIYRGGPGGTLAASATVPASQVPYKDCTWGGAPPWTEVTFDPGNRPRVQAGYGYAIALEPEPATSSISDPPSYAWYSNGAYSYTGGEGYYRYLLPPSGWSATNWSLDFLFRAYVDVPDTDGDGLANDVDQCDNDPGLESNNGCPLDTAAPTGSVQIEGGASRINFRTVTLTLDATDPHWSAGVDSMRIKNAGGSWTAWQTYAESKGWKLTRGTGKKTVYAQYRDAAGNVSANASDSITYRP